jgi:hypothetical protein
MPAKADIPPQISMGRTAKLGGSGFLAPPDHAGTDLFHVKPYPKVD